MTGVGSPVGPADVTEIDTVIVGAGFGGIGMAIRLARRGESFVILERESDVGGTWRDNTYPGIACDIPSHLYSFSFAPKSNWTRYFAPGGEILQYLRDCVRAEGLGQHIRLQADVLDMRWNEREEHWSVTSSNGTFWCRNLVIAAGRLSNPRLPPVPGLGSFAGHAFHSSRWPEQFADAQAFAGARVGIVGSGASAVQLTPPVVTNASSVVLFQRTAPYIVPRPDFAYSDFDIERFLDHPGERQQLRDELFWKAEEGFAQRLESPGFIDRLRELALAHLHDQVPNAVLRDQLTPTYEIGCKRVALSSDYYPALIQPTVTLEPSALARVDRSGVVAESGNRYDLDVLILATGFETTKPPFATRVYGRGGVSLAERWRHGMEAFASTTVTGFPNLFVIDGPNASLGHNSAIYMIEAQITYILGAFAFQENESNRVGRYPVLDVSAEAQTEYIQELDRQSSSTVWLNGGCSSWYVDETSRRLTLLWPDFAFAFRERLHQFDAEPYLRSAAQRCVTD